MEIPTGTDLNAWKSAGFYAAAYSTPFGEIISYRGTDAMLGDGESLLQQLTSGDIWNGWSVGAGFNTASQAVLAMSFYESVTTKSYYETASGCTLVGHSLGGGLAGFVSALSGTAGYGFDHMPFGVARSADDAVARPA